MGDASLTEPNPTEHFFFVLRSSFFFERDKSIQQPLPERKGEKKNGSNSSEQPRGFCDEECKPQCRRQGFRRLSQECDGQKSCLQREDACGRRRGSFRRLHFQAYQGKRRQQRDVEEILPRSLQICRCRRHHRWIWLGRPCLRLRALEAP